MRARSWIRITTSLILLYYVNGYSQNEPFVRTVLNQKPAVAADRYRLAHPFELLYGPDDKLYITEKPGRILQVDTATGYRKVLLDIRSQVSLSITRNGSGAATSIGQDGMMGMDFHPNFGKGSGQDSVFVAFRHTSGTIRIVRYRYIDPVLTGPTIIITGIPAGTDHSSGRMIIGPDLKIYYTCGDLGSNQFNAKCNPIRSQDLPSAAQIAASNFINYAGKILRINLDGSIPDDNPLFNGVRSHVYTVGHRNAQGLVWEKTAGNGSGFPVKKPGGKLFSSEHGPRTDDEINIIEGGRNYGWPYIAGFQDNINYSYVNWNSAGANCASTPYTENAIPAGAIVMQESQTPLHILPAFKNPMMTAFPECGTNPVSVCNANGTDWMKFATIAPSSIDHYNINSGPGIPGWYPSLLLPTLRKGTLYRVKLNSSQDGMESDTIPYFSSHNRYRDIAMSPDGRKIFIITDSIGSTSGPSGTGTSNLADRGAILVYEYTGAVLSLPAPRTDAAVNSFIRIYPNPATDYLQIQLPDAYKGLFEYSITDLAGRTLIRKSGIGNSERIKISAMRKGVYIIQIWNPGKGLIKQQKIILQ